MRFSTIIMSLCLVALFLFGTYHPTYSIDFSVMGGVSTNENNQQNLFDNIGYMGGVQFNLNQYIGVIGTFGYHPDVEFVGAIDTSFDLYFPSVYGITTFARYSDFTLSGTAGFEWVCTSLDKLDDIEWDNPNFSFGLLGSYKMPKGFGLWCWVSNTMPGSTSLDDLKFWDENALFDNFRGRAGLMYTF